MKASEVIFQQLLDGSIQYRVPLFQRTYSWDQRQWDQLWDDILDVYGMEKPRNHFIGAVVNQPIPDAPERVAKFMLIDGQQRFTTLSILLAVIRCQALTDPERWGTLADEIQETCLTNKFGQYQDEQPKLRPTEQDREAFSAVIAGEAPPNTSQIGKAWAYFQRALEVLKEGDTEGGEIDLRKLKTCITHYLDLVSINLEQDDSPNRIFESLNNTGMRLSVSDLIRNYLLMNIPNEAQRQEAYDRYWYPMQERLRDDDGNHLSDFFWRYLMMEGSLPRWGETFNGVKELIGNPTPEGTLNALRKFSRFSNYYCRLAQLDPTEPDGAFKIQIGRLNQWVVDVAYPTLLYLMDQADSGRVSEAQLIEVMGLIESFVVRRTVCGVATNRLRRIFALMSSKLDAGNLIDSSREYLLENQWPGDARFHEAFVRFPLYVRGRLGRTRLVLTSLERSFGHKEMPEISANITVEHIMPQTLTPEWKQMLGPNHQEVHAQWLNTMGNLTLSGYNPDLSNRPFCEKKQLLASSNFALSNGLQDYESWDGETIQGRATVLADRAVEIWGR